MAVDSMKVIYKVLEYLDNSMDEERVDGIPISAESLGISDVRWSRIISMMVDQEMVTGFVKINSLGRTYPGFKLSNPSITLRGLEYLSENSSSAKLYRAAKEIKEWIPGL